MVTDPSLCPVPSGFRVIGGFNDAFDNFRDTTPYDHWKDENGVDHGENDGVSKRWKNPELRSANLLCGFQFKIGPDLGTRWKDPIFGGSETIGTVTSGDVTVHFPRRDGPGGTRGGYIVSLKWFKEGFTTVLTEQGLGKEIPHGDYAGEFGWGGKFNLYHPELMGQTKINDGNWHSFLAVAYNELLPRDLENPQDPQNFGVFPIIRLWYSHTPTTKFEDFTLLGWGVDTGLGSGRIPPRGPLIDEIGEGGILEEWWGDEIFRPEHLLQIRIDDVPLDQIAIRNMYSATVHYNGITPPQNPSICQTEAKAILDRQPAVRGKEQEIQDLVDMLETATGDERAGILAQISRLRRELSPLMKDLRAAEFSYESCVLSRPPPPPPVAVPNALDLHPTIAKRRIENAGLRANMIGCARPTCFVSSQDPDPDTVVLRNSVVTCRSEDSTL